jgi:ATP-dependent Lon protease
MEIIHLSGYFLDEKINIVKRYLIPKVHQETGLKEVKILAKILIFLATNSN